jgi:hypothetical protein
MLPTVRLAPPAGIVEPTVRVAISGVGLLAVKTTEFMVTVEPLPAPLLETVPTWVAATGPPV